MEYSNYKGRNVYKYSTGGVIGDVLSNAGTGAAIGTTIGGPIGTAIGAGAGALLGLTEGLFQNSAENKASIIKKRNAYITKINQEGLNNQQRLDEYNPLGYNINNLYSTGGMIKKSKIGTFTTAAKKHHMTVQEFANEVLNHKDKYTTIMIRKAVFAKNFAHVQHKADGGNIDINTNSITKKIGDGIEVLGNNKKDAINANVDGIPVKLDNKEIVVDYNGMPVVISDDLGEATKYRQEIAAGGNPKLIAEKYAIRAIALNNNNKNKFSNGGELNNFPMNSYINNSEYYVNNPNKFGLGFPIYGNDNNMVNTASNNFRIEDTPINNTNIKTTMLPEVAIHGTTAIPYTEINAIPSNNDVTIPLYKIGASDINIPTNTQDNIQGNNTGNHSIMSDVANGLGVLGSTISNISAYDKLNTSNLSKPSLYNYVNKNIDANKSIFERKLTDLNTTVSNFDNTILNNTENSNVALNRINAVRGNQINSEGRILAAEIADRNRINNSNTMGRNRVGLYNNQIANRYSNQQYANEIGKIQAGTALVGSTLQGINGLLNNMKRDKYQNEYLQAIAQQIGFSTNGNININNLSNLQKTDLLKKLRSSGLITR